MEELTSGWTAEELNPKTDSPPMNAVRKDSDLTGEHSWHQLVGDDCRCVTVPAQDLQQGKK